MPHGFEPFCPVQEVERFSQKLADQSQVTLEEVFSRGDKPVPEMLGIDRRGDGRQVFQQALGHFSPRHVVVQAEVADDGPAFVPEEKGVAAHPPAVLRPGQEIRDVVDFRRFRPPQAEKAVIGEGVPHLAARDRPVLDGHDRMGDVRDVVQDDLAVGPEGDGKPLDQGDKCTDEWVQKSSSFPRGTGKTGLPFPEDSLLHFFVNMPKYCYSLKGCVRLGQSGGKD